MMPSVNKTPNIGLNQWEGNEYPKRTDFNEDNLKVDTAIQAIKNEKGQPNGLATLGPDGKVPSTQLPTIEVPVTSVNQKTGDVVLTASDIGAETPTGAQQKVDALSGVGNTKTVKQVADEITTHMAEDATQAHLPLNVGLGNVLNVAQIPASEKGVANGVATLDANGNLNHLPNTIWQKIDEITLTVNTAQLDITVPSELTEIKIKITDLTSISAQQHMQSIVLRFNDDITATDYRGVYLTPNATTANSLVVTLNGALISYGMDSNATPEQTGVINISKVKNTKTARLVFDSHVAYTNGSYDTPNYQKTFGAWYNATELNKISIFIGGTNSIMTSGTFEIWGR